MAVAVQVKTKWSDHSGFEPHRPLPVYADNAAALAAGEPYGELYAIDSGGELLVRMVNTTTAA